MPVWFNTCNFPKTEVGSGEKAGAPIQTLENLEMKKTLVALAALAATSAFAQSVTLYGLVDIGYGAKQIQDSAGGVRAKQSGVMDGGFAGNRIGFRGTEDLGSGQAVDFVIEQGISPTNGALFGVRTGNSGIQYDGYAPSTGKFDPGTGGGYQQDTNRQTFAALRDAKLGQVRVGYQYTTLYEISTLDGYTTMSEGVYGGSNTHVFGQGFAGGTRADGITYISPRMQGFGFSVQSGSAKNRDTTEFATAGGNTAAGTAQEKNKRGSFKLDYEQGPLKAAWGHTEMVYAKGATAANSVAPVAAGTAVGSTNTYLNTYNVYGALTGYSLNTAAASAYNTKMDQLAAVYTGSNWKVGVQYNSGTANVTAAADATAGSAATAAAYGAVGSYKFKSQRISGQYTIGALDLIAGQGTGTTDYQDGTRETDQKETQIGAIYNLSKTSNLYVYNAFCIVTACTHVTK